MDRPEAQAGLSADAAERILERDGPNVVVRETRSHRLRRIVGPVSDPMVLLLLVAAPTYLVIGDTTDAIVAFVALGPIVAVGWLLEARAEHTLQRLRALTASRTVVRRDGKERSLPVDEVVVGDLVVVREGDVVPADAVVLSASQIELDESSLTGESLPVRKVTDPTSEASALWAGTTVLSGRAEARVVATGTRTRFGAVGLLLEDAHASSTPLQRALARLVRALAVIALVVCGVVVLVEVWRGRGWGEAIIAGVSLAIAAIPEEFSMVYVLYLSLGAWRLAQQNALVRRLPSVETLGSTTVICTDKTGTLTEGRLTVASLWTPDGGTESIVDASSPAARALIEVAVRACEPDPFDPLDRAIVGAARGSGLDVGEIVGAELVSDWPFDVTDRYVTHAWADGDRFVRVASKGSIEGVLDHARAADDVRTAAMRANEDFAADGMRVVAVAGGVATRSDDTRASQEATLELCGLLAFSDPIRTGVDQALADCRRAGIRVVMITGDHPATAGAVARRLHLSPDGDGEIRIGSGSDLDTADSTLMDDIAATVSVVARARPDHKHRLVEALRRRGDVVAMTGDGINDAPALREADIGVAMGGRGTDVARSAASIVLLDDDFTTIVHAVREGRRIYDNLTRAFSYLVAFHPPLIVGALVVPLTGRPLLLLPVHLVVLELVLHPVVSLVFQADAAAPDTMSRPPRPVGDALRLRSLARPYLIGGVLAVEVTLTYLVALTVWPADQARALAFATLIASQPVLLLGVRSPERPLWRSGLPWTRTLVVVVAALTVLAPAFVLVPPLARLLHLEPFPWPWWGAVATLAASTTWAEWIKRPRRAPRS